MALAKLWPMANLWVSSEWSGVLVKTTASWFTSSTTTTPLASPYGVTEVSTPLSQDEGLAPHEATRHSEAAAATRSTRVIFGALTANLR